MVLAVSELTISELADWVPVKLSKPKVVFAAPGMTNTESDAVGTPKGDQQSLMPQKLLGQFQIKTAAEADPGASAAHPSAISTARFNNLLYGWVFDFVLMMLLPVSERIVVRATRELILNAAKLALH